MKQTILAGLLALLPLACQAVDLPGPLTITFYKDDKGDNDWADATKYPDTGPDQKTSPYKDDKRYLGYQQFTSTDDPQRVFFWQPANSTAVTCRTVISGIPNVTDLIYHLDSKTFEHDNNTSGLNLVHVRCDQVGSRLANPLAQLGYEPPPLNETDFEEPLDVQFYVTEANVLDWSWDDTPPGIPSEREAKLEGPPPLRAPGASIRDSNYYYTQSGRQPAFGDSIINFRDNAQRQIYLVGRYSFLRYRSEPRTFKWKLHKDDKVKQCYFQVLYDPHTSFVQVNMDDPKGPKIDDPKSGDKKAFDLYCEEVEE